MKKFEVNRKKYERIRKMDHNTLTEYINGVYQNGYKDGCNSNKKMTAEELKEVIMSVKGVGEAKAEAIVSAISAAEK